MSPTLVLEALMYWRARSTRLTPGSVASPATSASGTRTRTALATRRKLPVTGTFIAFKRARSVVCWAWSSTARAFVRDAKPANAGENRAPTADIPTGSPSNWM